MLNPVLPCMEHRGIQFTVVQTANTTGFKWVVEFSTRTKSGFAYSRHAAVLDAVRAINKELGSAKKRKNPASEAAAGGVK